MTEIEKLKQMAKTYSDLGEAREVCNAITTLCAVEDISPVVAIKGIQMALCQIVGLMYADRPDESFEQTLVMLISAIVHHTTNFRKDEMERRSKQG